MNIYSVFMCVIYGANPPSHIPQASKRIVHPYNLHTIPHFPPSNLVVVAVFSRQLLVRLDAPYAIFVHENVVADMSTFDKKCVK